MKRVLFGALLAVLWSAPIRAADTHEAVAEDAIKAFSGFADALTAVKDKESAQKANPDLKKWGEQIAGIKKRMDVLGEPKADKREELDKKYKPKMEEAVKKMQAEMSRIATKVDGGLDILKSITDVLAPPDKK